MDDLLGKAIVDYHSGKLDASLSIYNHYGEPDEMPIEVYFRDEIDFSPADSYAVNLSQGKILEIGAGAGAVCLALQDRGLEIEGLDISPGCVQIMKERGVARIIHADFFKWVTNHKFDTILMLMNGIGFCSCLANLTMVLNKLKSLLNPGGQILFDSSDVTYLYPEGLPTNKYYGEIDYQYGYNGTFGQWFSWLYVDFKTLCTYAKTCDLEVQLIMQEETGQYLVRAVGKNQIPDPRG